MVGFSLLCASYYYNLKGLVCYVCLVYNIYSYDELSIYVFFMLLRYTPTIGLHISMFAVCGKLKILEGSRFACLQRKMVFEHITKELNRNL